MSMEKIVNRAELAAFFGYSLPTIDTWVRKGCPVRQTGDRGRSYEFDVAAVHRWLLARDAAGSAQTTMLPEGEISLVEARRRHEVAKALAAELDLEREMDRLAPVAIIERVVRDELNRARAVLLAVPVKLRPAVRAACGEEGTGRLIAALEEQIRAALCEVRSSGAGEW